MLLKSYVSSQKLALSVSNASYERSKFKAFSRLIGKTYDSNQLDLESLLKQNLDTIMRLKQKIKSLESENTEIAE
jgi:hypothetical protein